jgi:hypothetical protein
LSPDQCYRGRHQRDRDDDKKLRRSKPKREASADGAAEQSAEHQRQNIVCDDIVLYGMYG